ncbi:hypothetical protein AAG906_025381 [Vitis piasezkii]
MASSRCPLIRLPTIGDGAADSIKGGTKGHVVVRVDGGAIGASARPFSPNYSLVIPGRSEKRGHIVDRVEKASFVSINYLR